MNTCEKSELNTDSGPIVNNEATEPTTGNIIIQKEPRKRLYFP